MCSAKDEAFMPDSEGFHNCCNICFLAQGHSSAGSWKSAGPLPPAAGAPQRSACRVLMPFKRSMQVGCCRTCGCREVRCQHGLSGMMSIVLNSACVRSRRAEDRRRNRIQEVEADNADRSNEESECAAKRLRASPEQGIHIPCIRYPVRHGNHFATPAG